MSAHVLLILLNELGKRAKMRGLPSILSLFRNEFVSGYRCVSDCSSRGREFDPGPVPYFRGD